jgi:hypothetical protein
MGLAGAVSNQQLRRLGQYRKYEHWSERVGDVPLDFYALPEDLERARNNLPGEGMIEAFHHYFGEYPFKKDGYKLIQAPYSGMEHQSAVTYGKSFANGYLERDWTGVGISPRFRLHHHS